MVAKGEHIRGCGTRRAGGMYIVSGGLKVHCERFPIPLEPCPCCGEKLKQTRGFQWVRPEYALKDAKDCEGIDNHCPVCPVCTPTLLIDPGHFEPHDKVGLIWAGERFYPKPEDWLKEATKLGASKRIPAIPKEFVPGKTFIFVAHPKAINKFVKKEGGHEELETTPGIIQGFTAKRVELIVTPGMKTAKWVKELVEKKNVKLVEVPEDDPDHVPIKGKKSKRRESMDKLAEKTKAAEVLAD